MTTLATVRELQQRITHMQPLRLREKTLPTRKELSSLLPDGAITQGGTIAVHGSIRLALTLLSAASQSGAWCGAIGVSSLGIEAAHRTGIALERFVMIPSPGVRTLSITSTLSEVLSVILINSPSQPSSSEMERLNAKLREHGAALIVLGPWPRAASTLSVTQSSWMGLEQGHGMLDTQEMNVRSEDRRGILQHRIKLHAGNAHDSNGSSDYPSAIHTSRLTMVPS